MNEPSASSVHPIRVLKAGLRHYSVVSGAWGAGHGKAKHRLPPVWSASVHRREGVHEPGGIDSTTTRRSI